MDNIISEIKILEEREARAKEKATTATEFDKIRRIISRQKKNLVKKGQSLSFKEFQKIREKKKGKESKQDKLEEATYTVSKDEFEKLTLNSLDEEKRPITTDQSELQLPIEHKYLR